MNDPQDIWNLHKYYYRDYFSNIPFDYLLKEGSDASKDEENSIIVDQNKLMTGHHFSFKGERGWELRKEAEMPGIGIANINFPLKVQYPGLVTGIGTKHEVKIGGEFKLGMHFDWTYGMPVIYGSSVKGVLKSAFIAGVNKGEIKYDDYFLKKVTGREWGQDAIGKLFSDIFNGKGFDGKNKSIYSRDIFFDAIIKKPDSKGRILCPDSVTPHGGKKHDNSLEEPNPLTFVKIAPGCELTFRFKLVPTKDENGNVVLSEEDKKNLFREILTTVGIGAKTNVGYGQLEVVSDS